MGRLLLLTILMMAILPYKAQNIMFHPLHHSYEYDYVMYYLNNLPAEDIREPEQGIVQAYYDGFSCTYYFNEKKELYKVETVKTYAEQARMKRALRQASKYLIVLNVQLHEVEASMTEKKWAGKTKLITGIKVKKEYEFDLVVRKYATNDTEVTLGGMCMQRKPATVASFIPTRKTDNEAKSDVMGKLEE